MRKLFCLTLLFLVFSSCESEIPNSTVIYMWLSTTTSDGDIGGVSGADSICNKDGAEVDLPSNITFTHKAVIAASSYHPRDIIPVGDSRPVHRPDGTVIVSQYSDFFDPTKEANNSITGTNRAYWSGLTNSGNISTNNCLDWSNGTNAEQALLGDTDKINRGRYSNGTIRQCRGGGGNLIALLCISY